MNAVKEDRGEASRRSSTMSVRRRRNVLADLREDAQALHPHPPGDASRSSCRTTYLGRKGSMKVRPSVKPMCERCRVIKRHGTDAWSSARTRATSSGRGRRARGTHRRSQPSEPEAARDRADVHLRHRPADGAQDLRSTLGLSPDTKVRDLTDEEVTKLRNYIDDEPPGRGRPAPRALAGDQAPPGDRRLPRASATAAASRSTASGRRRTRARARARRRPSAAGRRRRPRWHLPAEPRPEVAPAAASRRTSPSARRTSRRRSTTRSSRSPTRRAT